MTILFVLISLAFKLIISLFPIIMTDPQLSKSAASTSETALFKYHMDKELALQKEELQFFNRINRYRYDTVLRQHFTKWFRVKPFVFTGIVAIIAYDWTFGWNLPASGH